ncbi:dodecin family protein [Halobacteriovorax sp. GB3]|uniref:dodecin n=1 Tax=Halobacteriovorax sp. GB3 TaxID=2719615 RepID=UPI0023605993|nr:dodecin [Halobacteriovorax sp. GB3]MDD0853599.1 dodecin family protein [Halobacteriovorax sp. GB3]
MPDHTYKKVEIVGASHESIESAVQNAYEKASQSIHKLRWFEIQEIRGNFEDGKPLYQVTMKVGFRLDD